VPTKKKTILNSDKHRNQSKVSTIRGPFKKFPIFVCFLIYDTYLQVIETFYRHWSILLFGLCAFPNGVSTSRKIRLRIFLLFRLSS